MTMSKTRLLLLSLFLFPFLLFSQDFSKAPVKGVKTIVEWVQQNGKSPITKGYVYRFLPNGKLDSYRNDELKEEFRIEYDHKGRISKTVSIFGFNNSVAIHSYKKTHRIVEEEYKGNFTKTLSFYKGKKLIEKKVLYKNSATLGDYQLYERFVYHYDQRDSLRGEMYYNYDNEEDESSPYSRKILHRYDEKAGRKINITEFGFDRKWQVSTDFDYADNGKLRKKTVAFKDSGQQVALYKYKNDQLWQIEISEGSMRVVKVYKNGRPIRKKTKEGRNEEVVDYQYEFY